jgi:hypothetical protein
VAIGFPDIAQSLIVPSSTRTFSCPRDLMIQYRTFGH